MSLEALKYGGMGMRFVFRKRVDGMDVKGVWGEKKLGFELKDEKVVWREVGWRIGGEL